MDEKLESISKKMRAEVTDRVPDHSGGAFGAAALAETLRQRLEPGQGKRPGRPQRPEPHLIDEGSVLVITGTAEGDLEDAVERHREERGEHLSAWRR